MTTFPPSLFEHHCAYCGSASLQLKHVTRSFGNGAAFLIIENIPMWLCPSCHESYFSAQAVHEMGPLGKIVGGHRIEAACRQNVLFMAVSGDSQPNFTTLAAFVSELGDLAATLFGQVLMLCDRQGLIGRQMFAIDGVKLPSHASKATSGTRKDFLRQAEKMERAAAKMLATHRAADSS